MGAQRSPFRCGVSGMVAAKRRSLHAALQLEHLAGPEDLDPERRARGQAVECLADLREVGGREGNTLDTQDDIPAERHLLAREGDEHRGGAETDLISG